MDARRSACLDARVGIILIGTRRVGTVEDYGDTCVQTRFVHFNGLPIKPEESILVLGPNQEFVIPRHARSVRTGYLRTWACVGTVALGVGAAMADSGRTALMIGVGALVSFGAWGFALRDDGMSDAERARRRVFARVTGYPVDPRLLVHANPTLTEHLRLDLARRGERSAPEGYRQDLTRWIELTRSQEVDASFLAIAMTLARIDGDTSAESEIWERLAPRARELPKHIAPISSLNEATEPEATESTETARTETTPVEVAPAAAPHVWPTTRGTIVESGTEVTFPASAWSAPPACVSCLGPAETIRRSQIGKKKHVDLPYCRACRAHGGRESTRQGLVELAGFVVGSVAAASSLLVAWSLPLSLACALLAAVSCVLAVMGAFPAARATEPATMGLEAARLVALDDDSMTLFCTNDTWARRAAEQFGGTTRARRRMVPRVLTIAAITAFGALGVGGIAWHVSNPMINVDNATGEAVDVWIDGRVVATIQPTTGKRLDWVRAYAGVRRIGWSKAGAGAPASEITSTLSRGHKNYLLDPGARHCYWVDATVYGSTATVDAQRLGARPQVELQDLSWIDEWFTDPPRSSNQGTVHYQLTRSPVCAEVEARCPKGTRETYWSCLVGATTEGTARCAAAMRAACNGAD